jgi:hypothetical protein
MEISIRMKMKKLLLTLLIGFAASAGMAQQIGINGVDRDGYGGVYEIVGAGFDGGNYWWMCIEPNGSQSAGAGGAFLADALSLSDAWDQHNTERLDFYTNNPSYYTTALPTQVNVMEYVLDTYLPWSLVGPSGRFTEQSANSAGYGTDDPFYNAFFTVQNFLSETYGKTTKSDFSDMSDYNFFAGNATGNAAAEASRSALFQSILDDVEAKALVNFFDNYTAQGTYLVANSNFSVANNTDPNAPDFNWQDALIIVAPVPEPSGALLIACTGLVVIFRRFRRLAPAR